MFIFHRVFRSNGGASTPAFGKAAPIVVPSPEDEVISRNVTYADLNLLTPRDRFLSRRVRSAVHDLCAREAGALECLNPDQIQCTQALWEQARPQIDLAVQRAREIAFTRKSSIAAAALRITVPAEQ